jgi:hypothetical protein
LGEVTRRISQTIIKTGSVPAGFRAELRGLDLSTLLQVACSQAERSVVRVRSHEGEEGYVYIAEGTLSHASVGALSGEAALVHMLGWHNGEAALCERPWPLHPSLSGSLDALLIRAAQLHDEAHKTEGALLVSEHVTLVSTMPPPPPGAEAALIASVRIDLNGDIVAQHGDAAHLAQLVSYVTRLCVLLGPSLGLAPFEAMCAELGAHRVLIFSDGSDMVGLRVKPGPAFQELRRQLRI